MSCMGAYDGAVPLACRVAGIGLAQQLGRLAIKAITILLRVFYYLDGS